MPRLVVKVDKINKKLTFLKLDFRTYFAIIKNNLGGINLYNEKKVTLFMKFAFTILLISSLICKISSANDLKKFTDEEILKEYKKRFHSKKENHKNNQNRQHEDIIQTIRQMMKADQSMFNNFFDDDTFFKMNKKMNDMMQQLESNSSLSKQQQNSLSDITYNWEETSKDIILKINLNSKMDQDIIVKIEGTLVTLSQSQRVEHKNKTKNRSSFGKSFSSFKQSIKIPDGVNSNKAIINNNKKVIVINFPKKSEKTIPLKYDNDSII